MKIFFDDNRKIDNDEFLVAKDYHMCVDYLTAFRNSIDFISLDYQIDFCDKTGYDVLVFMKENEIQPKSINIHSDHSVGVPKMLQYCMNNFKNTTVTTNKA